MQVKLLSEARGELVQKNGWPIAPLSVESEELPTFHPGFFEIITVCRVQTSSYDSLERCPRSSKYRKISPHNDLKRTSQGRTLNIREYLKDKLPDGLTITCMREYCKKGLGGRRIMSTWVGMIVLR